MMSGIIVSGEIPVVIEHFRQADRDRWNQGDHSGFPTGYRLGHCVFRQPQRFFAETTYVRTLEDKGYECWQETFELFKHMEPTFRHYRCSAEIEERMGTARFAEMQECAARVKPEPAQPDIVAYHPSTRRWAFFEVKLMSDRVRPAQVNALGLLKHIFGDEAEVAVVRYVLEERQVAPSVCPYRFTMCISPKSVVAKLYHFTDTGVARDIEESGFRAGDDGKVWFAVHPKEVWGAQSTGALFEIRAPPQAVEQFRIEPECEEELDALTGEWVKCQQREISHYYALPPEAANAFPRRKVPAAERRRLMV